MLLGNMEPSGSQYGTRSTECHLEILRLPETLTDLTTTQFSLFSTTNGAVGGGGGSDGGDLEPLLH